MQKTMTIEITKFSNNKEENSNLFEWTKTFEVDYDINKKITNSKEENELIQQEIEKRNNELNNKKIFDSPLINTQILQMEGNPFHQPSMNTFEFNINNEMLIQVKNNESIPLSIDEKLIALNKLLEEKIITNEEYNKQKQQIVNLKEQIKN